MDSAWAPVVGAGIGATAALLSQLLAWVTGGKRLRMELAQRDRDSLLRYSEPLRDRRIDALVRFHELIQDVLESGRMSLTDYGAVRPYFAFITDGLRDRLVGALAAVGKEDGALRQERRAELLELQTAIRAQLQAPEISKGQP